MPALFVFLLKVNLALLLFCAGYYLVLRHLTFYTLNRIYLVTAILFASVYPQINLTGFAQRHQQLAKPVQSIIYHWQAPAEKLMEPLAKPDYWQWVEVIFWAGAAVFTIRLLIQLYSLSKLYRNSKAARLYDHNVRLITGDGGPFSFWQSIYVNPERHEPEELKSILLHEQVHVNEWHTLDILLAEFSIIFYWFNPGIWLMKKAIRENVEFITDRKILNKGIDSRQYQYSLVNVSFAASPNTIVNHFNISTIKKRIIMMNAKRSSGIKLTRYAFLIPAVVALLLVFSISKAELITKSNKALTALKLTLAKDNLFVAAGRIAKSADEVKGMAAMKAKTNDTIRNGGIFISTKDADSINFVINGVKVDKAAFKALNPKKVANMDALPAEEANKVLNQPGNKNTVFFVTTSDSEAGKKFKEKLDKLTNRSSDNDSDFARGYSSSSSGDSFAITRDGNDSSKTTMTSSKVIFVKTNPKLMLSKTTNLKLELDTVMVKGHVKNLTFTKVNGSGTSVVFAGTDSAMTTTNNSTGGQNVLVFAAGKAKTYHNEPIIVQGYSGSGSLKTVTVSSSFHSHETDNGQLVSESTDNDPISKVLIIINGKEATEKELLDIIKAGNLKTGLLDGPGNKAMIDKYGDKAKKGIFYGTTKKNN